MDMTGLQLVGQHFPRQPVPGRQGVQPVRDDLMQTFVQRQIREPRPASGIEHRPVRPVKPGLHQVVLLGVLAADIVQGDAQRRGHIVQVQPFPRGRLRQIERRVQDAVAKTGLLLRHGYPRRDTG